MQFARPITSVTCLILALVLILSHTNVSQAQDPSPTSFSFVQDAKVSPDDKTTQDQFATSVSIYGSLAIVGVPQHDKNGASSGAAYLFSLDDQNNWQQKQQLVPRDGVAGDFFGTSVALNETVILVGARNANNGGNFSGAVYVFTREADGTWTETQKLTPSDATAGRFFGWSLALAGDTALIGAPGNGDDPNFPGTTYLLTRDSFGRWTETQKLIASDGVGRDEFGFSVSLFNNTALIGARGADEKGTQAGAAYLFTRSSTGAWEQIKKLTASDGSAGNEFGYAVALGETTRIIGARFASGSSPHTGAVYVYEQQTGDAGSHWTKEAKLTANEGRTGDEFGAGLAFNQDALLISAPQAGGTASGIVYLFAPTQDEVSGHHWTERQQIRSRDGAAGDMFGTSLALQGKAALIGSPGDDIEVESTDERNKTTSTTLLNIGSAYFLTRTDLPGTCTLKTDYAEAQCSKTFFVTSLTDLDEYFASDFGRKDNKDRYANLEIVGDLSDSILNIHSPCKITIGEGIILTGDFVSLDGRQGITGKAFHIDATRACLLSEQQGVTFGNRASFSGDDMTLQAPNTVAIGQDTLVTADGAVTLASTGSTRSSNATIGSGTLLTAGSLHISAPRTATLQANSSCTVDGSLFIASTGDSSRSAASIQTGARVHTTDLTVSSRQTARIGKNVRLTVTGNLHIEAGTSAQCNISKSATVSAAQTSGNCF